KGLDQAINGSIHAIIQDPRLAVLARDFGVWKLYALGSYDIKKILCPLDSWGVYSQGRNVSYEFRGDASSISLQLRSTGPGYRVTIFNLDLPKLNLSDYDYGLIQFTGTRNAIVLTRFFLSDGTSFDLTYWKDQYDSTLPVDLSLYFQESLRGDVYVGLRSSDGAPASISIYEVSFIKILR